MSGIHHVDQLQISEALESADASESRPTSETVSIAPDTPDIIGQVGRQFISCACR